MNQWKQYQLEKNIVDAATAMTRLTSNRVQTVGLLQLVLPLGWRISKKDDNKTRWVERDLQCKQSDLYNVFQTLKHNKIHIHNYFESDFNKDFLTVRLNVVIDSNDILSVIL